MMLHARNDECRAIEPVSNTNRVWPARGLLQLVVAFLIFGTARGEKAEARRKTMRRAVTACPILFAMAVVVALQPAIATAQPVARPADSGFSFAVYGDSRSMMYLPYKTEQEAEARKLMVQMFDLVLPEKVSEEVVQKYVKLVYDPATKELVQMVMPPPGAVWPAMVWLLLKTSRELMWMTPPTSNTTVR